MTLQYTPFILLRNSYRQSLMSNKNTNSEQEKKRPFCFKGCAFLSMLVWLTLYVEENMVNLLDRVFLEHDIAAQKKHYSASQINIRQ